MMSLPPSVASSLSDSVFHRQDVTGVEAALLALGSGNVAAFHEFYLRYEGPFGSKSSGFELLDLCVGNPCVVSMTKECRVQFGFPNSSLVLSELLGGAILVFDSVLDKVYNVDFEGSERELVSGTLEPRWHSFYEFLESYFG